MYVVVENSRNEQGGPQERAPLGPQHHSASYGSVPPPCVAKSPPRPVHPGYPGGAYQADYYQWDSPPPLKLFGGGVLALILLFQFVAWTFYYDLPARVTLQNETMARMRMREEALKEETKNMKVERIALQDQTTQLENKRMEFWKESTRLEYERFAFRDERTRLENERIALQDESDRLERERIAFEEESAQLKKERLALESSTLKMEEERKELEAAMHRIEQERLGLKRQQQALEDKRRMLEGERLALEEERKRWEKARDETNIPQGAFWDPVWPIWECLAYGRREYWGVLRNIPNSRDHMDACMNMPVTIEGVTIRRPDRCQYEGNDMRAFWMVDWNQADCKPWLQEIYDKVSLGISFRIQLGSRTSIPRDARTRDQASAGLKPRL